MKHFEVNRANIAVIKDQTYDAGSFTVTLTQFGSYIVNPRYGTTDAAARRTPKYTLAVNDVSRKMQSSFEANERAYTRMEANSPKVHDRASAEHAVPVPKMKSSYKSKSFNVAEPTSKDIDNDLQTEAQNVLYGKQYLQKDINDYVSSKKEDALKERKKNWEEAKKFFYDIENAKAQIEDENSRKQYQFESRLREEIINGSENAIDNVLQTIDSEIKTPFDLGIDVSYTREAELLSADVELLDGLQVPNQKAVPISYGKISIKNKLLKEIEQTKYDCVLSLSSYLASVFFNVSPYISKVRITIWDVSKGNGLCCIEFTRDIFVNEYSKPAAKIGLTNYRRVMDVRTSSTGDMSIKPINAEKFKKQIAQEINN